MNPTIYLDMDGVCTDFASAGIQANPRSILIDDYELNVTEFRRHGGQAVLFPQIWNSNHRINNKIEFTLESVKQSFHEMQIPNR